MDPFLTIGAVIRLSLANVTLSMKNKTFENFQHPPRPLLNFSNRKILATEKSTSYIVPVHSFVRYFSEFYDELLFSHEP